MNDPIQIFVCRKYYQKKVLSIIEETDGITSVKVFLQPPDDGMESEGDSGDEISGELSTIILTRSNFRAMLKRK